MQVTGDGGEEMKEWSCTLEMDSDDRPPGAVLTDRRVVRCLCLVLPSVVLVAMSVDLVSAVDVTPTKVTANQGGRSLRVVHTHVQNTATVSSPSASTQSTLCDSTLSREVISEKEPLHCDWTSAQYSSRGGPSVGWGRS
jgi:hypothetical protein